MDKLIGTLNIYSSDEYQKFIIDSKNNRPVKKDYRFKRLRRSIIEKGQTTPIIVKQLGNKYIIANGQHRAAILQEIGKPIIYTINNELDLASLIEDGIVTIKYEAMDFVKMGANRGIPIFILIDRLVTAENNKLNLSSIIEITFTYIINDKKIFANSAFSNKCKKNYNKVFEKCNKPIHDEQLEEIMEFINLADKFSEILGPKKLKVNLVRQALLFHLSSKFYDITLDEIISFLKSKKRSAQSKIISLEKSSKDREFKTILREIAYEISKNK